MGRSNDRQYFFFADKCYDANIKHDIRGRLLRREWPNCKVISIHNHPSSNCFFITINERERAKVHRLRSSTHYTISEFRIRPTSIITSTHFQTLSLFPCTNGFKENSRMKIKIYGNMKVRCCIRKNVSAQHGRIEILGEFRLSLIPGDWFSWRKKYSIK